VTHPLLLHDPIKYFVSMVLDWNVGLVTAVVGKSHSGRNDEALVELSVAETATKSFRVRAASLMGGVASIPRRARFFVLPRAHARPHPARPLSASAKRRFA